MKAKKLLALAMALCLAVLCLAGCGQKTDGGTLTVATSPDFAPMEFVDTTKSGQDQYVGFDIELAKYIADAMGKELVIQPMSFNACQTAVGTGSVDMAISGFSWSEKREEGYNLSDPYYPGDNESQQVIITTKANENMYLTPEDFKGVKVAAQTASLPLISISTAPIKTVIGTNTVDCMRSGLLYGAAFMVDGMIEHFEQEIGEKCTVIATGGFSSIIKPLCKKEFILDTSLIMKGLLEIYKKNA